MNNVAEEILSVNVTKFFKFNNFILRWYCTIAEANKNQPLITINMVKMYSGVYKWVNSTGVCKQYLFRTPLTASNV